MSMQVGTTSLFLGGLLLQVAGDQEQLVLRRITVRLSKNPGSLWGDVVHSGSSCHCFLDCIFERYPVLPYNKQTKHNSSFF